MKLRDVVAGANASMYHRLDFQKIRGVYYPRSEAEVVEAIEQARAKGYEITPKGGGSGLSGACTGGNRDRFIVSTLQMKELLTISKDQGYVDVQPGATPDEINEVLEPMGMKLYVSPSSRDIATLGGLLATDGGGNDTWANGTMRDNTVRVKMVLYDGRRLIVDWEGVRSDDAELALELNKKDMTIHDVASAHGTLGFVTELRVTIRPLVEEHLMGAIAVYEDFDALGSALDRMIKSETPIRYGEAIVEAHKDVRDDLTPPILILEFPEKEKASIAETTDFEEVDSGELERLKDIRIKLPKRNPNEGVQAALFEGYGFFEDSLRGMQSRMEAINGLLIEDGFEPFAKYGHGPSKWYLGDNTPAFGLIMHSREIRPTDKTGKELFETVLKIVDLCDDMGITPKPEHKWPFSDKAKKTRIEELRTIIGEGFNAFIFEPECASETLSSMV
ncbi:MAG: FAD-binding oxidoreductase [Candidatus Thorarchaeota archaeon]|nr:MAG: FAD-binding oxidoreductase [Candidatus Thorarchaeota archaeon]